MEIIKNIWQEHTRWCDSRFNHIVSGSLNLTQSCTILTPQDYDKLRMHAVILEAD